MRNTFVKTLYELAKKDKNIQLITGDLGFGVFTDFWTDFPNQFINVGIAEQNMAGVAAGMGLENKIPFIYSIGNFPTLRALEQIRNDIAYHKSNVKIVAIGGGFAYGALGMSHHATEDLAILRALPEIIVFSPCDPIEVEAVVKEAYKIKGPCYIRLGKGGERNIHNNSIEFSIGKSYKLKDGKDISIFSTGSITEEAMVAAKQLNEKNIDISVYSFPTIKPIDQEIILKCAQEDKLIITLEEHNIIGGLGGAVAEIMSTQRNNNAILKRMGLKDEYTSVVGDQKYLKHYYKIDAEAIVDLILKYQDEDKK